MNLFGKRIARRLLRRGAHFRGSSHTSMSRRLFQPRSVETYSRLKSTKEIYQAIDAAAKNRMDSS